MLVQDALGCLDVQVSLEQGQYLFFAQSVVGKVDVALEEGGEMVQSGRVDFFILYAQEQTGDGEVLMGKCCFVSEEEVQAVRV